MSVSAPERNAAVHAGTALRLDHVGHSFGSLEVLRDISLAVRPGEFLALVGPSGCGKTTLLNLLSGYLTASRGSIEREGTLRMVYQSDGLFPWLTVGQNISLGLRHLASDKERSRQLHDLLALIRMDGFASHYPHQISGGMRQRAELARALAGETDILLMDEPFSALDYQTRLRMRHELARLLELRPKTVVLVTHDIEEACQLADRVLVLTSAPAQISMELPIRTPRPRSLAHPEVVESIQQVLHELGLREEELMSLDSHGGDASPARAKAALVKEGVK
jgi:NitT/TauT family transport system ATP-binding protein